MPDPETLPDLWDHLVDYAAFVRMDVRVLHVRPLWRPTGLNHTQKKHWGVFERDDFRCWICGKQAIATASLQLGRNHNGTCTVRPVHRTDFMTIDHLVPLVFGGAKLKTGNLRTACNTCNSNRGAQCGELTIFAMTAEERAAFIDRAISTVWYRIHGCHPDYPRGFPFQYQADLDFMAQVLPLWDDQHEAELLALLSRWDPIRRVFKPASTPEVLYELQRTVIRRRLVSDAKPAHPLDHPGEPGSDAEVPAGGD